MAAEFFTGNQHKALDFLISHGYIRRFSKSRFNRRLHKIPGAFWQSTLFVLAQMHQQTNTENIHIVDTFPVPVCRNTRIKRCKIYKGNDFHGYCASKKEYFFGLKVCLIVTEAGQPVEMLLVPGAATDITALGSMDLNLPEQSTIFGDSGFLDRPFETALRQEAGLNLVVPRRKKPQKHERTA